ncbi:MAG: MurR/RpiR family transcriptional regulator [Thermovirgaceae bacterium]|nr:MurR/RpiR family transcriptional regulator [Thermovirgaceae bacterium]
MLGERIAEKMPALSPGQQSIAKYILGNPRDAAFLTAFQLGEIVGVSESTVIRFAAVLGYSGYPEMRSAVREILMERLSTLERLREYDEPGGAHYFFRAIDEDIKTLSAAQASLDTRALEELGSMVAAADQVLVAGQRSSRALAYYLWYYLSWLFPNIHLLDPDSAIEKVINASPKSLVIGISFPRYTSWTVEVMRHSHMCGIPTASITNDYSSPLATWSNIVIPVPWNPISFIDSFTAPISIMNCVILGAARVLGSAVQQRLEILERTWGENEVYVNRLPKLETAGMKDPGKSQGHFK